MLPKSIAPQVPYKKAIEIFVIRGKQSKIMKVSRKVKEEQS